MSLTICKPCLSLGCDNPPDLASGIDGALYSSLDFSFIVECPTGCFCPPGLFPRTISILASTIPPVIPPINEPGDPIILRLQGCTSLITRTLSAGSSQAEIAAAAQSMQAEWAGQQALCLAAQVPGVNCNTGTSISVCNDAQNFDCPLSGQVTVLAGVFCEQLNTTGLSSSQIAAATAAIKARLNALARQSVCPFSGVVCAAEITFSPFGNVFNLNITNNSAANYDGTNFCATIDGPFTACGNQPAIPPGGTLTDISISPGGPIGTLTLRYFGTVVYTISVPFPNTLTIHLTLCTS